MVSGIFNRLNSFGKPMFYTAATFCLILLLSAVGPTLAAPEQKTQDESAALIAEARELWEKGQRGIALEKLKKAITLDPENASAQVELADMYVYLDLKEQAHQAVAEALRLNPNYAPAHHRKAVLLRLAGDFEGAIREARLALSLKPDDRTAAYSHVTIGRALLKLKQTTEAADEFRKAVSVYEESVKRKSNDALAHVDLGDLLFELQRYDEAEASYRRALELDSKNSGTLLNLGSVLHNQGKIGEAVRYYKEYLSHNPETGNSTNIEARIRWLETTSAQTVLGYLLINAAETGNVSNVKALIDKGADVNFKDNYKTPLNTAARQGYIDIIKVLLAQGAKDEGATALAAAYEDSNTEIEKLLEPLTQKPLSAAAINRLLYAALRKGDPPKFSSLVQLANAKDRDELLLYALSQIKNPRVEIVRLLLDNGANVNQPTNYKTALMHAASEGYNEIVSLLITRGAQVNVQTDEGTPLMMAALGGNAETVKLLLSAGADLKATHRLGNQALIMAAARRIDQTKPAVEEPGAQIMELLLARGADPNARGQWGNTALMVANTTAKVNLLAANRAQVNAQNEQGESALMMAIDRGNADIVDALLNHGADINATDRNGNNALLVALEYENSGYPPDVEKLVARRLEVARRLLLVKGLNVNAQNINGETALMRAVKLGNVELVRSLLTERAEIKRADVFGNTAAVLAYEEGNRDIAELLPRPSLKGQPLEVLNSFLRTAIVKKDEAFVKELLTAGADPNHEYAIGYSHKTIKRTVLILAASIGHPGIVQMLLSKGANVNAEGLLHGSEHGLEFGTALQAAELSKREEVIAILKGAMNAARVPD